MNARFLDVRESTEHASGLQDGRDEAARSLNATLREIDSGTREWFTRIDPGRLGAGFLLRPGNAATLDPAKITSVAFSGGRWDVSIKGPNEDSVIVTLDASYKLLGTRRPDWANPRSRPPAATGRAPSARWRYHRSAAGLLHQSLGGTWQAGRGLC